ncbi:5-carboxymethyl-2-hydroxymuconate Delta-isomerase [Elizabethkingia meningoseptica]|uniref:5-carboxymethyl-2-hydroxymuconate Delta-isomerase n=1 Tax=Elizabethkingia meningoseptica TaxID=238 RepID=UPI00099989B0|nr:5-carboxymethyl-2-hydroxymuconate Delta-isomerase [Elizabethkingia meningoseptica]MDE5438994.1 5-carboxymethyl-2-hydroxymuconate Delta-isomerase [Elizabethkingia meningoseptica]MDE5450986.1 5-carboxymethyl-2-hydroxymuconate Delta-isomerase [Elizabethkingia meningoseptica]MDE5509528.1 5-carboxymethyl-2-hydroxymuconate Delta-isomerase [Elizabethkingia meningoseptica]MDE5516877.1 5-carboxymethyl-2-hydroxymuconate Delta-isomerase [Elizabethkingia meningoseptica]MDE5531117.1 5-carboxymethyl-2-hy
MPHFIIDCSQDIILDKTPDEIMTVVYNAADSTGLFAANDIKVRIQPAQYYKLGENKKNFIHVFGYIMEGRSTEQKAALSKLIITKLTALFPDVSFLAMSVHDFEAATYCNKSLINPENTDHNRHFEL